MKIILTSFFADIFSEVKKYLPDPKRSVVAFIPTAANVYDDKWFVNIDREKLVQMGYEVKDVDIANMNDAKIREELFGVDIIFVAGGNAFYLLEQVRKSGFDEIIKEKRNSDVVYVGSSAGSLLACPSIDIAREFDDHMEAPSLKDFLGLGLVDFLVLPHYGKEKYLDKMKKVKKEWQDKGFIVRTLRDDQAIVINNDNELLLTVK